MRRFLKWALIRATALATTAAKGSPVFRIVNGLRIAKSAGRPFFKNCSGFKGLKCRVCRRYAPIMVRNASAITGSNCVPAFLRISSSALESGMAFL